MKPLSRRIGVAAVSLGLVFGCAIAGYDFFSPAQGDMAAVAPSVLVTELSLRPGSMDEKFTAYGSVQPGTGGDTIIAPAAAGILGSLRVAQGDRVAAGQVLAIVYPDAFSIADAEKAASAFAAAKSNYAHVSALLASHLATVAELSSVAQSVRDAQATQAAMRASGTGVRIKLIAPFAGSVTAVFATNGTAFAAGAPLLRIANQAASIAYVSLPPDQAARIKAGDSARISLLDTGGSQSGTLTGIATQLDPQTGLVALQIALAAPADLLLGQPVEAVIVAQILRGFVVPRDGVQTDDAGDFVYQVDPHNIAHRTTVRIIVKDAEHTLIAADIDARLPIVTTGAAQLADGMAVRTSP